MNELPTSIQRALFERATSLSEEDQTLALREQIARFTSPPQGRLESRRSLKSELTVRPTGLILLKSREAAH